MRHKGLGRQFVASSDVGAVSHRRSAISVVKAVRLAGESRLRGGAALLREADAWPDAAAGGDHKGQWRVERNGRSPGGCPASRRVTRTSNDHDGLRDDSLLPYVVCGDQALCSRLRPSNGAAGEELARIVERPALAEDQGSRRQRLPSRRHHDVARRRQRRQPVRLGPQRSPGGARRQAAAQVTTPLRFDRQSALNYCESEAIPYEPGQA